MYEKVNVPGSTLQCWTWKLGSSLVQGLTTSLLPMHPSVSSCWRRREVSGDGYVTWPLTSHTHITSFPSGQWQSSRSRLKECQRDLDTLFWTDRLIVVDAMPYWNGGSKFVRMHYKGSGNQIWSWDGIQRRKTYDCYNAFTLNFSILWTWSNVSLHGRMTYQIVVNKSMLGENMLVLIMSFMSYNWYDFRHSITQS